MPLNDLKQAIKSVLIGVAVTLITQLAQTFVVWLQGLDAHAIGSAVAAAKYALSTVGREVA